MVAGRTEPLAFLWLEITGRCQLRCEHCYAESGPEGTHGTMTAEDWRRVLDEAAVLGVRDVQLIGGEPTLHPELPRLVRHALALGLGVEVYSNLARTIPEELWGVFAFPGVRLATSYYATDAPVHDAITTRRGSHRRTRANIDEARRRGIPLRAGVVAVDENQDVSATVAHLEALGIVDIGVDQLRQVGRGMRDARPEVEQLCGRCADGSLAVSPTGEVWPCVFARWLALGNVREIGLAAINDAAQEVRAGLRRSFSIRADDCAPKDCRPKMPPCTPYFDCKPKQEPNGCRPRSS